MRKYQTCIRVQQNHQYEHEVLPMDPSPMKEPWQVLASRCKEYHIPADQRKCAPCRYGSDHNQAHHHNEAKVDALATSHPTSQKKRLPPAQNPCEARERIMHAAQQELPGD